MKQLLSLTAALLFIVAFANAQDQKYVDANLKRGIHPGTVTTLDKKVLQGYVFNGDHMQNQKHCIFYTDYNDPNTKTEYSPSDLVAYTIENLQYKSIPYSGNIGSGKGDQQFVYVAKPGFAINTFVYYTPAQQILWQKGDEDPVSNATMLFSFKKTLLNLLGDDPDLAATVNEKGRAYLMMNLDNLVDKYNTWAQAKK
ncbi:hypothetical protein [Mucilaginibacter sp.]|uniref:hypothetical protein n=1 Tax=Mucilaginibacter sp. TaxID=1882438 RepID=UPI00283BB154|nr:hypothetical protein [Mucilaginibacter sp.]MDR3696144.1 hypothetical protein [Mucilaginibacter sp.]